MMPLSRDVLLVICPMWGTCLPPIGIAYIAAYLEHKGILCDVMDLNISLYSSAGTEDRRLWQMENFHLWSQENMFPFIKEKFSTAIQSAVQNIIDKKFKIVGFSLHGANILFSIEMAKALREKAQNIRIVFGGSSCCFLHENPMPFRFLTSNHHAASLLPEGVVDFIVAGEGEESFFEIVSACIANRPVKRAGIVPVVTGNYGKIEQAPCISNLDTLPFPAWHKFPLKKYDVQGEMPILFSRGCVNRCTFCNDWRMWDARFRFRSAKNIFEEMKTVRDHLGKKTFRCNDLLFNGNLNVLDELADLIMAAGLTIHWTAQGIVRTDMKPALLRKLKQAGMTTIIYGVESLSDNVLKMMGKPFCFADINVVLENTKKAGINTWINLIIGFPGETEQDFQLTKKNLEEIRDHLDTVSSLNPCHITALTDLEIFPEKFSIVCPPGKDACEAWETLDGKNTPFIRKQRIKEIYEFLRGLSIQTNFIGIYDGESPLNAQRILQNNTHIIKASRRIFFRRLLFLPLIFLLAGYHFFLTGCLQTIKFFRKTIVFPGG